jgi:hypothetical protein
MSFVIVYCVGEHEDIIQVDSDEYPDVLAEYPRHETLKGGWRIAVTLLHDVGYECP